MKYCSDKTDVVRYVKKFITNLPNDSALTIIIEREKFADYYVDIAISTSSEGTQNPINSKGLDVT